MLTAAWTMRQARTTLNPIQPGRARQLVTHGLFASGGPLLVYALAVAGAFHLRVTLGEEPWLAQVHGSAWSAYVLQVPRWLGVRRLHTGRDA